MAKLRDDLKRLGFKHERKKGGSSWFIISDEVNNIKKRFGFDSDPKNEEKPSPSSLLGDLGTKTGDSTGDGPHTGDEVSSPTKSIHHPNNDDSRHKNIKSDKVTDGDANIKVGNSNGDKVTDGDESKTTPIATQHHQEPSNTPTLEIKKDQVQNTDNSLYSHWACPVCHQDNPELFELEKSDREDKSIEYHRREGHDVKQFTKTEAEEFM